MAVKTSQDAYELIYTSLARCIEGSLENGFEIAPINTLMDESHYVDELIAAADRMVEIESKEG